MDCTKGVQYLNEIKDSVVAGFQWATKEVKGGHVLECASGCFPFSRGYCARRMSEESGSTSMMSPCILMQSIVVVARSYLLQDVSFMPVC